PLSATGRVLSGLVEGAAFTGVVGSFRDPVPGGTANKYAVTIAWGDGQTALGAVTSDPKVSGGFNVSGGHTYTGAGSYAVTVTIVARGGATASVGTTAVVADARLTAHGVPVQAIGGETFTGVVATFTDANPAGQVSDFTAQIDWGNGQTSAGTVVADAS